MEKIGLALVAIFDGQLETASCLNSLSFFPGTFTDNPTVGKYVEEIEYNPEKNIEIIFDVKDFNKKSVTSLKEKYGNPNSEIKNDAPMFSEIIFKKDSYKAQSEYLSTDKRTFAVSVWMENEKCTSKKPINKDRLFSLFQTINLKYIENKLNNINKYMGRRESINYDGWEKLYVDCGPNEQIIISVFSQGWDKR